MPKHKLRATVAAELEKLCDTAACLHISADHATWSRYGLPGAGPYSPRYRAERLLVHKEVLEQFWNQQSQIKTEGLAAVATAGPPAAGKTTRLKALGYTSGWRRIDPDNFKEMLIGHDLKTNRFALPPEVETLKLADGKPLMPLELSGLYHHESTELARRARVQALAKQENVIIEGTLSWKRMATILVDELNQHGYQSLDVVLVEVPLATALEQALERWWLGRQAGGLGGRFTPASTISNLYLNETETSCAINAHELVTKAQAASIQTQFKT